MINSVIIFMLSLLFRTLTMKISPKISGRKQFLSYFLRIIERCEVNENVEVKRQERIFIAKCKNKTGNDLNF